MFVAKLTPASYKSRTQVLAPAMARFLTTGKISGHRLQIAPGVLLPLKRNLNLTLLLLGELFSPLLNIPLVTFPKIYLGVFWQRKFKILTGIVMADKYRLVIYQFDGNLSGNVLESKEEHLCCKKIFQGIKPSLCLRIKRFYGR